MLEAALEINGLTLPELAKFNIYMRKITSLNISDLGDPVAGLLVGVPFKGASAIAVTLRDLVAEGVLPALAQVHLAMNSLRAQHMTACPFHPCRE